MVPYVPIPNPVIQFRDLQHVFHPHRVIQREAFVEGDLLNPSAYDIESTEDGYVATTRNKPPYEVCDGYMIVPDFATRRWMVVVDPDYTDKDRAWFYNLYLSKVADMKWELWYPQGVPITLPTPREETLEMTAKQRRKASEHLIAVAPRSGYYFVRNRNRYVVKRYLSLGAAPSDPVPTERIDTPRIVLNEIPPVNSELRGRVQENLMQLAEHPDMKLVRKRIHEAQIYERKLKKRYQHWEQEAHKLELQVKKFKEWESSQDSQGSQDSADPDAKKPKLDAGTVNNIFDSLTATMTSQSAEQKPQLTNSEDQSSNAVIDRPEDPESLNAGNMPEDNESGDALITMNPEGHAAAVNTEGTMENADIKQDELETPRAPSNEPEGPEPIARQPWHFLQTFVSVRSEPRK